MKKAGVVAFAFGAPASIPSNQHIGRIASEKARALGASVYTQADVSIEPGITVNRVYEEDDSDPPPTLRIARGAVQWAKLNEISMLWVVCAKPHLWRCVRDLEYAVREAKLELKIHIHICREIEQVPESEWFCADSEQKRTRSPKDWWGRERLLRVMPMCIYKIVAS